MIEKNFESGYAEVNGLRMYYEIYGQGKPLVLIHGGGSTIQTSFGRIIPLLAKQRQVVAVELQAHGHTNDRDTDLTFEQDADDVAAVLSTLKITNADFLGFSNGGQTAIELAIRHPALINKIILASAFYKRSAAPAAFWSGFESATIDNMPRVLQEGYLAANNSTKGLMNMFKKDVQRMKSFKGWPEEKIKAIKAPVLVINANNDVGSMEHAVGMYRTFPDCELAVFPGGHGSYLGAIESINDGVMPAFNAASLIEEFLEK